MENTSLTTVSTAFATVLDPASESPVSTVSTTAAISESPSARWKSGSERIDPTPRQDGSTLITIVD
jgi:hypothetical protein